MASVSRVAAIILTVDQREVTLRCLESVSGQEGIEFALLLWDNGSSDGTAEAVHSSFPDVHVHRYPENLGVASGRNAAADLAIQLFSPSHLLFLDNDLILAPGFVAALVAPFEDDPMLAQTQAKLRFADGSNRLNDAGGCRIQFWLGRTTPVGYREVDRGQYDRPTRCVAGGGAMMVRSDVFRQLRGFDAAFDPVGPEDLDFSLRAYQAGYHALYVPTALAYHTPSHTRRPDYTAHMRVRQWFHFIGRHASPGERVAFALVGAPLTLIWATLQGSRLAGIVGRR